MCEQKASYKTNDNKAFDVSRNYWKSHGVSDWGIVIEEGCRHMNKADIRKRMLLKIKIAAKKKSVEEDICIVAIVC